MGRPKKVVVETTLPEEVQEVSNVCPNCDNSGLVCSVCHFDPYTTSVV